MEQKLHEPCPVCQGQPEVKKGKTYWTAFCPKQHIMRRISSTPMKTKKEALAVWDDDVKNNRF